MLDDEHNHAFQRLRQEGLRLHDLGQYNAAIQCYERAREKHPDAALVMLIISSRLCQGRLLQAIEEMDRAGDIDLLANGNEVLATGLKMTKAFITFLSSMKLRDGLTTVAKLYQEQLVPNMPHSLTKQQAAQICLYLNFRHMARLIGTDIQPPPALPPLSQVLEVHTHLMSAGHFCEALSVLEARAKFLSLDRYIEDLGTYIAHPNLPELDLAFGLHELANTLAARGRYQEANHSYDSAMQIFKANRHEISSAILSIDRCEMELRVGQRTTEEITKILWELHDYLRSEDHLEGIRRALEVLYEVAFETRDESLRAKLNEKYEANANQRGRLADWISQRHLMIFRCTFISSTTSYDIEALIKIYDELAETDYNTMKANTCRVLIEKHKQLEQDDEASVWEERLQSIQTWIPEFIRYSMGLDQYYERIKLPSAAGIDADGEAFELQCEIEKSLDQLSAPDIASANLWVGVIKIPQMAQHFMNCYKSRTLCQTERLVCLCVESEARLAENLGSLKKKHLAALMRSCTTRLEFTKAHVNDSPEGKVQVLPQLNLERMHKVLKQYHEVEGLYQEAESPVNVAITQRMMASVYQEIWTANHKAPDSSMFGNAVAKQEAAHIILAKEGNQELRRHTALGGCKLWLDGHRAQVKFPKPRLLWKWLGLGIVTSLLGHFTLFRSMALLPWIRRLKTWFAQTPLDEAARYLLDFENLVDRERLNLSTLGDKSSIIAKQCLVDREDNVEAVTLGVEIFASLAGGVQLWQWVQRSKARSLSDLLGIGLHMPAHIERQTHKDIKLQELLTKEHALVAQLKDPAADQLLIWTNLENHRKSMRNEAPLRELLDLREGSTVSPTQLIAPRKLSTPRHVTWYVDWIVFRGMIFMLAVSDTEKSIFERVMSLTEAEDWIAKNMTQDGIGIYSQDEDEGTKALAGLYPLISPLPKFTTKGDLLVLCLAEPLHNIPVHAALIFDCEECLIKSPKPKGIDPGKRTHGNASEHQALIERNPIVYTYSMTAFHQCTSRSFQPDQNTCPARGSVLSVYEEDDKGRPLPEMSLERNRVYDLCKEIADRQQWDTPACGHKVTKENFAERCKADIVHFHGHFERSGDGSQSVFQSGLLLGDGNT